MNADSKWRLELVKDVVPVYAANPKGAALLAELVEEVYDLIEAMYPHLDVEWLRSVFRYQRPFWDEAPPF